VLTKEGHGFARHLQALEQANPHAYYDYSFQTFEYSDHGNLLQRFLSLPVPKCFLYGSENRHLSYLQRLLASECTVVEIPNANHFLFSDQPDHYAAALASFARNLFPLRETHDTTSSDPIAHISELERVRFVMKDDKWSGMTLRRI
jgi:hypothetical protein